MTVAAAMVPDSMRWKTVELITTNIASISFSCEKYDRIDATDARKHAAAIEEGAFSHSKKDSTPSYAIRSYGDKAVELMYAVLKGSEAKDPHTKVSGATEVTPKSIPAPPKEGGRVFDISGGKREFLDKAAAETLLEPLLASPHLYTKVCLSGKSFSPEAADVAARALARCRDTLVDADLSDIIAGQKEADALGALSKICSGLVGTKLSSLNLSDNALGEKGVRACAAALRGQRSIKHLFFCNNGISVEAAEAIRELLPSGAELETLHFFNNMSGDGGAKAVAHVVQTAPNLHSFRFSSTRVGTDGGVTLAHALGAGCCLRKLDLRDNMFGPRVGEALAAALGQHTQLCHLLLSDTGLKDSGASAVAAAVAKGASNSLQVLELSGNDISAAAAPSLARSLGQLLQLRKLNLAENELGDGGVVQLVQGLGASHRWLEEVDLSSNEVGRVGAVAAAQAVAQLEGGKVLNLNGNRISDTGIDEVKRILKEGRCGEGVLGPLDENDEEGGGEEEEEEEGDEKEGEEEVGDDIGSEVERLIV